MDFTENEENTRTDQNYIMEIRESVMQLHNITPLCQAGEIAPKEASGPKIYQSFHHF